MKTRVVLLCIFAAFCANAQNTAFTYQGRLADDSTGPSNGSYDLIFALFGQASGGPVLGSLQTNGVPVGNGLFAVSLDGFASLFNGSPRWLGIQVRTNGSGAFTELLPLQPLQPTPYSMLGLTVPNGAITSQKLAAGAVTAASIASNSITGGQIAPGSITPSHLAAQSIGVESLAKPYQSSSISLETFFVSSSFSSLLVTSTVAYPVPFTTPPVVTVSLDAPYTGVAEQVQPILVRQKRTNGFDISFRVAAVPVQIATRTSIDAAPMAMVNGRPAVVHRLNLGLGYTRSLDSTGLRWAANSVIVSESARSGMAFLMGPSYPSVAYADNSYNVKFVRATETNGVTWGSPVLVQSAVSGTFRVSQLSMAVIGGRPALALYDFDGRQIYYTRANDANGDSWPVSPTLIATGAVGVALGEVSGRPAISFPWDNGLGQSSVSYVSQLRYIRASDSTGAAWPALPSTLETAGPLTAFSDTGLITVAGTPGIFYLFSEGGQFPSSRLYFTRSSDSTGTAWSTEVAVYSPGTAMGSPDYGVVTGQPAAAWYDSSSETVRYSSSGNNGASFFTSIVYHNQPNSGSAPPALLDVGSRSALTYSATTSSELRYIRDGNQIADGYINWIAVAP